MFMRRSLSKATTAVVATSAAAAAQQQRRSIYTQYHATTHDFAHGKAPTELLNNQEKYFHMNFVNVPVIEAKDAKYGGEFIKTMSEPELYLYSAIVNDTDRLSKVDWTYGFDAFWGDRLANHEQTFATLYGANPGFLKFFLGNYSNNVAAKREVEAALNTLRSMYKWAAETERCFTAIFNARFVMQREIYDALERERYLGGVLELVEDFHKRVPAEYKRKACLDLDWHMHNMKMWTADIPNLKRAFPRST